MSHIEQFCESAIAKGDGTSSNDHEYFESMKEPIQNLTNTPNYFLYLSIKMIG
ncbi:hypothetical protein PL2TA16_00335 [Pseudoalteromonas luteoviolacea 2ta16]|uniref:Uncharacterized protein n=1 Tax=Pseudoalteromonas luteoviolacea (strain 2ta16) TaxID=1353533 RepID=V4H263_PSEL2|nr:hypothetical protein PL2TA16_00335 [Pseudoalteromonas luteoviolacea 2ta16]